VGKQIKKSIFLVLSVLIIFTFSTACKEVPGDLTLSSMAEFFAPQWVAQGGDPAEIKSSIDHIKSSGANLWLEEWVALAEKKEKLAASNLEAGQLDQVFFPTYQSFLYYRIAAFPFAQTEAQKVAFKLGIKKFLSAQKFAQTPVQPVSISFEGREILGYLRYPKESNGKIPLVILINGFEGVKEDFYMAMDRFHSAGYAVFTFDLPGTGESYWSYRPDSTKVFKEVLNYFQNHSRVDSNRIAVMGFNFGGSYALWGAAGDKRVKALVLVGPAGDSSFNANFMNRLPVYINRSLPAFTGYENYADFMKNISKYSISDSVEKILCPILLFNSQNDLLSVPEDLFIFTEKSLIPPVIKTFKNDPYSGYGNLNNQIYPAALAWLKDLL
jgi:dienelactone hydrolase